MRISRLDLIEGGVTGGEPNEVALGIAWYRNRNARVMMNAAYADSGEIGTFDSMAHVCSIKYPMVNND